MNRCLLMTYKFLLFLILASKTSEHHIGYTESDGPNTWNGTCRTGHRQSPIDIQASAIIWAGDLPRVHFVNYGVSTERLFVSNNGHSISVSGFDKWGKEQPYIYGGPLNGEYLLQSFHFHWAQEDVFGSEHTIGGLHYPAEVHFVHRKRGLAEDGILQSDSIVVLGIFLGRGYDNKNLKPFENSIQEVAVEPGKITELKTEYSIMDLLPTRMDTYYTYDGSLTTPGCNEVVTWIVFTEPVSATNDQINLLRQTIITKDGKPGSNFRPTQPLNGRKIRFRPATQVSSSLSMSFFGLITVILSGLFFHQTFLHL